MIRWSPRAVALAISAAVAFGVTGTSSAKTSTLLARTNLCKGSVSWQKASRSVGRVVTVEGRVAGTHYASASNGAPTFLNLGVDYPDPRRFVVLIWSESRGTFGGAPERRYAGRTICVRGGVALYNGVPEIEARTASQIRIAK